MTAPNALSVARIALVPLCVGLLLAGADTAAAIVFAIAAATDSLDGYLARSRRTITTFGTFVDPLADKLLVSCTLIALVGLGRVASWVAMLIVAREFAVTGLRLVASPNEVIAASPLGKWKTFAQMVAILALILAVEPARLVDALVLIAVVLTIVSAFDYFRGAVRHLRTETPA